MIFKKSGISNQSYHLTAKLKPGLSSPDCEQHRNLLNSWLSIPGIHLLSFGILSTGDPVREPYTLLGITTSFQFECDPRGENQHEPIIKFVKGITPSFHLGVIPGRENLQSQSLALGIHLIHGTVGCDSGENCQIGDYTLTPPSLSFRCSSGVIPGRENLQSQNKPAIGDYTLTPPSLSFRCSSGVIPGRENLQSQNKPALRVILFSSCPYQSKL